MNFLSLQSSCVQFNVMMFIDRIEPTRRLTRIRDALQGTLASPKCLQETFRGHKKVYVITLSTKLGSERKKDRILPQAPLN